MELLEALRRNISFKDTNYWKPLERNLGSQTEILFQRQELLETLERGVVLSSTHLATTNLLMATWL